MKITFTILENTKILLKYLAKIHFNGLSQLIVNYLVMEWIGQKIDNKKIHKCNKDKQTTIIEDKNWASKTGIEIKNK